MRGHESLLALRRAGKAPAHGVCIDVGWDEEDAWFFWSQKRLPRAFVEIEPKDRISSLDLRFVAGLPVVMVWQYDTPKQRFAEAVRAVQEWEPRILAAVQRKPEGCEPWGVNGNQWVKGWPEGIHLCK